MPALFTLCAPVDHVGIAAKLLNCDGNECLEHERSQPRLIRLSLFVCPGARPPRLWFGAITPLKPSHSLPAPQSFQILWWLAVTSF